MYIMSQYTMLNTLHRASRTIRVLIMTLWSLGLFLGCPWLRNDFMWPDWWCWGPGTTLITLPEPWASSTSTMLSIIMWEMMIRKMMVIQKRSQISTILKYDVFGRADDTWEDGNRSFIVILIWIIYITQLCTKPDMICMHI